MQQFELKVCFLGYFYVSVVLILSEFQVLLVSSSMAALSISFQSYDYSKVLGSGLGQTNLKLSAKNCRMILQLCLQAEGISKQSNPHLEKYH